MKRNKVEIKKEARKYDHLVTGPFSRPMEPGWVKYRSEAPSEMHEDDYKSWTKSDLEYVTAVEVSLCGTGMAVATPDGRPGKFWQSDDYECLLWVKRPVMKRRRAQMRVEEGWLTIEVDQNGYIDIYISDRKI